MQAELVALAIQQVPQVIKFLKELFVRDNPGAEEPTDEQVVAAYRQALTSSLAVDAAWLAAHPKTPPPSGASSGD